MAKNKIITPPFRVSFPTVFTPKLNELNGKQEYSLVALFPKGADLSAIEDEIKAVKIKQWGPEEEWPDNLRSPIRDQGEKFKKDKKTGKETSPDGYEKGAKFISMRTTMQPGLVDKARQPILDKNEFYSGCWARAHISVFAYDTKGNKGVGIGLSNVQKLKDDQPLGGRMKAEDAFEGLDAETADDIM